MKIVYKLIFGSLFFSMYACDIDRAPYDAITADDLRNSEESAASATLGNYSRLKAWTENWHRLHEYPGDNVALSGTTTDPLFFTYNYQRIPNGSRAAGFWRSSYQIIVGNNKIIEALDEGSSDVNNQLLAENYYMRALMHFSLVNIFGRPYNQGRENQGVPIKTDGDHLNHPPRATVGEVYDIIEADLLRAEALFTEVKSNVFASKEAVWALLSRIHLYKGENELAVEYADKVIGSGRFNLLNTAQIADYPKLAPEQNSETIFAIKFVRDADYPDNGWFTVGSLYANIQGTGWGEMYASRPLLEMLRKYPEDQRNNFIRPFVVNENVTWAIYVDNSLTYRWQVVTQEGDDYTYTEDGTTQTLQKEATNRGFDYFINTAEGIKKVLIDNQLDVRNGFPKYFVLKCSGQEDQVHLWSPVVSRLAEMYLNRAEANAKLGNSDLALADVNLIRERAGILPDGLFNGEALEDGKTVLEIVLEERQMELAYEGHRKLDVFRNNMTMDRRYPGTHLATSAPIEQVSPQDNAIVEFIPETQLLIHEGLTQNP